MKLGILSDTHGHVARTRTAVRLLQEAGAERLIHCGDIGSTDVLYAIASLLEGTGIEVQAVFGNVDEWDLSLKQFPLGLGISAKPVQFGSCGETFSYAVAHGHDWRKLEQLCASPELNVVFTGHTHVARDVAEGRVRLINPGAVYRASIPSVALLDTVSDVLTSLPLPDAE